MYREAEILNQHIQDYDFTREDFSYAEFTNSDFVNCDFSRAELLGATFTDCSFIHCKLSALITGTSFEKCEFDDCDFGDAYIFRSQFKSCTILDSSMGECLLSTADFTGSTLNNVDWRGAPINSPPIIIDGIEYPIVALDNGHMHVGCEYNTYEWFYNTDEKHSARMEGLRARRFWKRNKQWIFDMLKARKLYDYTSG